MLQLHTVNRIQTRSTQQKYSIVSSRLLFQGVVAKFWKGLLFVYFDAAAYHFSSDKRNQRHTTGTWAG